MFQWNITVPPNTTATIYVPAKNAHDVTEGDTPAAEARGVKFLKMEEGRAVFSVGSGSYNFASLTDVPGTLALARSGK